MHEVLHCAWGTRSPLPFCQLCNTSKLWQEMRWTLGQSSCKPRIYLPKQVKWKLVYLLCSCFIICPLFLLGLRNICIWRRAMCIIKIESIILWMSFKELLCGLKITWVILRKWVIEFLYIYVCLYIYMMNGHVYLENSGLNSSLKEHLFQV